MHACFGKHVCAAVLAASGQPAQAARAAEAALRATHRLLRLHRAQQLLQRAVHRVVIHCLVIHHDCLATTQHVAGRAGWAGAQPRGWLADQLVGLGERGEGRLAHGGNPAGALRVRMGQRVGPQRCISGCRGCDAGCEGEPAAGPVTPGQAVLHALEVQVRLRDALLREREGRHAERQDGHIHLRAWQGGRVCAATVQGAAAAAGSAALHARAVQQLNHAWLQAQPRHGSDCHRQPPAHTCASACCCSVAPWPAAGPELVSEAPPCCLICCCSRAMAASTAHTSQGLLLSSAGST